jgi:hypothetical protein
MGAIPMSLTESEFISLRQTITLRGTVRMALLPLTIGSWALVALLLLLFGEFPPAVIFPLAVLVGGFEAIHALHVGAERIGRYLQVYYEDAPGAPKWETTAMAVGPALPGGGIDPLFSVVFVCAAAANLVPMFSPEPTIPELVVIVPLHVAFIVRIVRARGAAARQRAIELESFRAVRNQSGPTR